MRVTRKEKLSKVQSPWEQNGSIGPSNSSTETLKKQAEIVKIGICQNWKTIKGLQQPD